MSFLHSTVIITTVMLSTENTQKILPDVQYSGKNVPIQQQSFLLAEASRPIILPHIRKWVGKSMTFRAHVFVSRMINL